MKDKTSAQAAKREEGCIILREDSGVDEHIVQRYYRLFQAC